MAYRLFMRSLFMRSASPLAALTLAAALLLSGCVPQVPAVVPPPEQTTEPVFASDEEALAAATDAYTAYLAMSDLIAQEGGANPERIAPFVTEEALSDQVGQFLPYTQRSLHTVGVTKFDRVTLQQSVEATPGVIEVATYVCLDVSDVRIIDKSGTDVTPIERANRLPLEVGFEDQSGTGILLMSRSETWSGSDFC